MIARIAAAVILLLAGTAQAQQQPDPRLAGPMIQALQAQIALLQAGARARQEDEAAERVAVAPALNAFRWFAAPLVRVE